MKLLATILLCSIGIAAAADVQLRIVRHNKAVAEPPSVAFTTNIIALLQSCSVHSTAYAVGAESWQEMLRSDSFVHLAFAMSTKVRVMGPNNQVRKERSIEEILVPLPEGKWPACIFAKSGTNVLSFTKYEPVALKRVVFEPALQLSSVRPYDYLAKIKETKR